MQMPRPPSAYVPYLYCRRGPKGDDPDPCSGVRHIGSLQAGGCSLFEIASALERTDAKAAMSPDALVNDDEDYLDDL
jgi:hypothetical protein